MRPLCTLLAYLGLVGWLVLPGALLWARRIVARARAEADAIEERAVAVAEAALDVERLSGRVPALTVPEPDAPTGRRRTILPPRPRR